MPLNSWNDVFSIAVYLINRLSSSNLEWVSSMETLFSQKPNYSFFKTFDCLCFPCIRPYNNHKLQPRSTPCIFLGYSNLHKGYKCRLTVCLYISRHITFNETEFPLCNQTSLHTPLSKTTSRVQNTQPIISNSPMIPGPFLTSLPTSSPIPSPNLLLPHLPHLALVQILFLLIPNLILNHLSLHLQIRHLQILHLLQTLQTLQFLQILLHYLLWILQTPLKTLMLW